MQIKNQSYLRKKNKEDIINLLRDCSRSYSDIARILKLSNTAVGKIAEDLLAQKLIVRDGDNKGRGGIHLDINVGFGYIFAIDLSGEDVCLCAADFGGNILLKRTIGSMISFYRKDFDLLIRTLCEMRESECLKGKKLYCICVASPGKFSPDSGKFLLNPRFKGFDDLSIKEVLGQTFSCNVIVKNDVKMAIMGEKAYGTFLKNVSNALMLHIDVGVGGALLLDGKIFEGDHGYAGEIGYFRLNMLSYHLDNFDNLTRKNYFDCMSLHSALSIIKREVEEHAESYLGKYIAKYDISPCDLTIDNMTEAYCAGDPLVVRTLNSFAGTIGTLASNLADFLDIDIILLNGAIINLGDQFLAAVTSCVSSEKFVRFSELKTDAAIMGAIHVGLTETFMELIGESNGNDAILQK